MSANCKTYSRVTVFCASSSQVPEVYKDSARQCGKILADLHYKVYYGGGTHGLMGALADSVLSHHGELIGIIPTFMMEMQWGNNKATELMVVSDMFERKKILILNADIILVLPGGCGTADELFEAITAKQLGQITAPIIIVNEQGFYDHLLAQLDSMVAQYFMTERHRDMWQVVKNADEIPAAISAAPLWSASAIRGAQL